MAQGVGEVHSIRESVLGHGSESVLICTLLQGYMVDHLVKHPNVVYVISTAKQNKHAKARAVISDDLLELFAPQWT
jgi:hypothetical protein